MYTNYQVMNTLIWLHWQRKCTAVIVLIFDILDKMTMYQYLQSMKPLVVMDENGGTDKLNTYRPFLASMLNPKFIMSSYIQGFH